MKRHYDKLNNFLNSFYSGIGHVLIFHRVCNENDYIMTDDLQVTQEYLEEVLKFYISSNIDIVSLDECYKRITSKSKVKRFVAFTFDDGYADNLTHALPVFEKYNAPFSIFLATGYPDHNVVLWWYLLEKLVMNNERISFMKDGVEIIYNTITKEDKKDTFWKIRKYIVESNQDNIVQRLKTIFNDVDLFELTKKLALSWEQVKELSNHPLVTIGTHTINHLAISNLKEDRVLEEINESINIIESKINKPVEYLTYPFGTPAEANSREFNIVKKCNIKMAFTTTKGNLYKHDAHHLYSLPRIDISDILRRSYTDLYFSELRTHIFRILR